MRKRDVQILESQPYDMIDESANRILYEDISSEMTMTAFQMSDKYGDAIGCIIDYMVCICMYPTHQAVSHWRSMVVSLCKRFTDIDICPLSSNTPDDRFNALMNGVVETFNADFSAILNHFRSTSQYYASSLQPHPIHSIKPFLKSYNENKEQMEQGIIHLTQCVARKEMEELVDFIEKF